MSRKAGAGGLTKVAVGLAFRELSECEFILIEDVEDEESYTFSAVHVTKRGWDWISEHERLFLPAFPAAVPDVDFEDEIPF